MIDGCGKAVIVVSFQFGIILTSVIVSDCLVSHDCWLVYLQNLRAVGWSKEILVVLGGAGDKHGRPTPMSYRAHHGYLGSCLSGIETKPSDAGGNAAFQRRNPLILTFDLG